MHKSLEFYMSSAVLQTTTLTATYCQPQTHAGKWPACYLRKGELTHTNSNGDCHKVLASIPAIDQTS